VIALENSVLIHTRSSIKANIAKLQIDEGCTPTPITLWSYWTEVHQMFTQTTVYKQS